MTTEIDTKEPGVMADDGARISYSEARTFWEDGEFSDWANAHGFPLTIGKEIYRSFDGIEDALSDETWDK